MKASNAQVKQLIDSVFTMTTTDLFSSLLKSGYVTSALVTYEQISKLENEAKRMSARIIDIIFDGSEEINFKLFIERLKTGP